MANIKYMLRGSGNVRTLHVRFYHGRDIDLQCSTGILVNPDAWDPYPGKYRQGRNFPKAMTNQNRIDKLKTVIIDQYNSARSENKTLNLVWFKEVVTGFFGQQQPKDRPQTLHDFADYWLENHAHKWFTGNNKTMGPRMKKQYQVAADLWREFQGKGTAIIKDVDNVMIAKFVAFLEQNKMYAPSTVKRLIGRIKFFLARAEALKYTVNPQYKERVYSAANSDPLKPYLTEEEIQRIFDLDLSNDDKLDNIRDCMIIALWTGLRISDFNNRLDSQNIEGGMVSIKTKKTGSWVFIPLHPMVKHVLRKRHGFLPTRYNDATFNEKIKTVCMLAEIDQEIAGKKYYGKSKRSVGGTYKKYELITSHTCRRSFASNLYGRVPNHVLADLGGWTSEKTMINYVKRTKAESAEVLKQLWDERRNF